MNWFGFMWIWAIALFMAGIFLAIENDQGGSRRSVWTSPSPAYRRSACWFYRGADSMTPKTIEGEGLPALLRKRRECFRLSLNDVAKGVPMTKSHLWELENGRSANPSIFILYGPVS